MFANVETKDKNSKKSQILTLLCNLFIIQVISNNTIHNLSTSFRTSRLRSILFGFELEFVEENS